MPTNPQTIPGEWKKDTPIAENPNPVEGQEAQSVPRTATGVVTETGDIVDQEGQAVGKIADSKDPQELVGNSVTAAGDVVSPAGNVLGKANLGDSGDEYTVQPQAQPQAQDETSKSSGGWLGKTKDIFSTVQGVGKPVATKLGSVGGRGPKSPGQGGESQEAATETAESSAVDAAEDEAARTEEPVKEDPEDAKAAQNGAFQGEGHGQEDEIKDTCDQSQVSQAPMAEAPAEEKEGQETEQPIDYSILEGAKVNKIGNLIDGHGMVVGRLVEGRSNQLQGCKSDGNGDIWNDSGKSVGKAEPISESERESAAKEFSPFENFPDNVVEADGRVLSGSKQIGTVVEGDPKRLKGSKVDEDGDILDRNGNVVGKAEPWDEPEPEEEGPPDRSMLAGKRVNKAGNVVDQSGAIIGRVVEGNIASIVGRMCDKDGNVRSELGDAVGKAEVVPEDEREGSKEGPFAELEGCTVAKDGTVVTQSGDIVGRLVNGDPKVLFGRSVDEDGDVLDRNGNTLAKAERWEEPEVEKKKGPLAGRKVNRDGNVLDDDGSTIGKLVSGDSVTCSGKEIDDDGDVINSKGQTVGHAVPLAEEESPEEKEKREQGEEDKKLAGQLSMAIEQSLEKLRPILKMITDKIDQAERTPKEELDEEQLVKHVKPLIEEGGKILTETNGLIRGMDPDGRIQRNAKHKAATKDASPEEHHLAEMLKELTGSVTETIDNAKRKIEDMPHAKKELNPLWGLLTEPLFQIIAAVGLLLNGVLGLVGRLLSGLGLGGLVDNLLGGLGVDKILASLGLGSAYDALTGKDQKK